MLDRRGALCRRQRCFLSSLLHGSARLIYLHEKLKDLSVTILKEQVSRFWFDRQPRNINEPPLLRRRCAHADKMAEEKGRKKGDTNNPVMQICTADFKVKTGTGI